MEQWLSMRQWLGMKRWLGMEQWLGNHSSPTTQLDRLLQKALP